MYKHTQQTLVSQQGLSINDQPCLPAVNAIGGPSQRWFDPLPKTCHILMVLPSCVTQIASCKMISGWCAILWTLHVNVAGFGLLLVLNSQDKHVLYPRLVAARASCLWAFMGVQHFQI